MNKAGQGHMDSDIAESLLLINNMLKGPSEAPLSMMEHMKEFFQYNPILERIPRDLMRESSMIAFMHTYAGALGVGVSSTSGIMMTRLPDRNWSAPVAVAATGMTFGIMIGAGKTSVIIVGSKFYDPKTFAHAKTEFGLEIVGTVGPKGDKEYADFAAADAVSPYLYTYTCGKGLMAGYSLKASDVYPDLEAMKDFYGHDVDVEAIMDGKSEMDIFEKNPDLHKLREGIIELTVL